MSIHFEREIASLKKQILGLGAMVEDSLRRALRSVSDRDRRAAENVILADAQIDAEEIAVEENCLKVLALHQPVARDLRFIVAVLKINNDLERIGDLAQNVAERAIEFSSLPSGPIPAELSVNADAAVDMVKLSLDALVAYDASIARDVCRMDDDIDARNRATFGLLRTRLRDDPASSDGTLLLLSVSRYIERIADHATNIAEDVIYMIEGEIVRHQH